MSNQNDVSASASHPGQGPADETGHGVPSNVGVVIASIAVLLLLASLDQTIVSTALPTIVAELGGIDHLSWVVTAYLLSSTIVAPIYGKLGDLYGRRLVVVSAISLFLLGSVLSGLATSMTFLIVARAIQGFGGGGLFVLALSIIGDVIQPKDRGKVQGVFGGVFSLSSVLGPFIGGWFTENLSWHWIFFINLPLGFLALAGFLVAFKAPPDRKSHKIDYAGALTIMVGLASIVLFTSLGGRTYDWASVEIITMMIVSVVSLAGFVWIEMRAEEPIIPLDLFKMNVFTVTGLIGFVAGAAMFGAITFLPLYLQIAKGVTPTVSGWLLLPMTAGILISSTVSGQFMSRTGKYKILPIVGMSLLTVGMLLMSTLQVDTSLWMVSGFMVVVGGGMGCIFPVVTTSVQNAVPKSVMGAATAAGIMFRQVGGSIGVAAFGAIFANQLAAHMTASPLGAMAGGASANPEAQFNPQLIAGLPEQVQTIIRTLVVDSIHPVFLVAAVVAVIGLLISFFLEEVKIERMQRGPMSE